MSNDATHNRNYFEQCACCSGTRYGDASAYGTDTARPSASE
jgi:hypothetical protein